MYMYQRQFGIEPRELVEAIKELEHVAEIRQIKPAAKFSHPPLKGLWHKHYFSARFLFQNLSLHHREKGIEHIIESHIEKDSTLSEHTLRSIIDDVVHNAFAARMTKGKLTGEWIVFAKYEDQNYYLALSEHEADPAFIYGLISSLCIPQFSFLQEIMWKN